MKKVTIVSQVYPPDPAAVGQYLADIAKEIAIRGWHVSVITANTGYDDPSVRFHTEEIRDGVHIQRLPWSSGGKKSLIARLVWQISFCLQVIFWTLLQGRHGLLLVSTSPPMVGFVAVALSLVCGKKFIWWVMDINPDQTVQSGNIRKTSIFVKLFELLNKHTLQRASQVITLDDHMAKSLVTKLSPASSKIFVIPPWPLDIIRKGAPDCGKKFREFYKLEDCFIIMYSGNHSAVHPLDTLVGAAEQLRDNLKIRFLFIGGGVDKARIENRIKELKLYNALSLPYQPLEMLNESLAAGDLHFVTMGKNMVGLVHPCKIYGSMALGKPIIYTGPIDSHIGEIIASTKCGWQFNHGNSSGLASKILELASTSTSTQTTDNIDSRLILSEVGSRGADLIKSRFERQVLTEKLADIITKTSF